MILEKAPKNFISLMNKSVEGLLATGNSSNYMIQQFDSLSVQEKFERVIVRYKEYKNLAEYFYQHVTSWGKGHIPPPHSIYHPILL